MFGSLFLVKKREALELLNKVYSVGVSCSRVGFDRAIANDIIDFLCSGGNLMRRFGVGWRFCPDF